jgi:hypothetical protein
MNILIQIKIFAERTDMSEQIAGQVWEHMLESGEEAGHIQCPKLYSLVCKTG